MIKRTISIKNVVVFLGILLLFMPCFLTSLWTVIIPNTTMRVGLLAVGLSFLVLVSVTSRREYKTPQIAQLMLTIILGFVFLSMIRKTDSALSEYFVYICTLIFSLFAFRSDRWITSYIYISIVAGSIYILTTFFFTYFPNIALSLLGSNIYPYEKRFSMWVSQGCCFGITDHNSTNAMAIVNFLLLVGSMLIYAYCNKAEKRGDKKSILTIVVIVAYIAIFFTGKRAHLLFPTAALLITLFVYNYQEKQHILKYFLFLIALVIVTIILYSFVPQVEMVLNRFNLESDGNVSYRFLLWSKAIEGFFENPILGNGWFSYRNVYGPRMMYTGNCHNIYIQLLCETGMVGLIVFGAWFVYSLVSAVKLVKTIASKDDKCSKVLTWFAIFSMAYQLYFLLYGISGNPLYDMYCYPIYYISCITGICLNYNINKIEA